MELGWLRHPLAIGNDKRPLQLWSHALEVSLVRLSNGNEKRRLQHLESCTLVWLGKTLPLLMRMRNEICNI